MGIRKVLKSVAGYSAALSNFRNSRFTKGTSLWEGPIACLMFVQFLKTDVRPWLFLALACLLGGKRPVLLVTSTRFWFVQPPSTTTHTNNLMFDFSERPRMIYCFVHRYWMLLDKKQCGDSWTKDLESDSDRVGMILGRRGMRSWNMFQSCHFATLVPLG